MRNTVLLTTLPKRQLLVVQDGLDVFQHAFRLRLDVSGDEVAGGGIERNLTGAEQQIADTHRVVIGADRPEADLAGLMICLVAI